MKIAVGADHAGYGLKEALKQSLRARGVEVEDVGCHSAESVDYPDYAWQVSRRIAEGDVDEGLLVCMTGIGMSIMANKWPNVRAALCVNPEAAATARSHNQANCLVLPGKGLTAEQGIAILDRWFATPFGGGRHARRVGKIARYAARIADLRDLLETDPELYRVLQADAAGQEERLNLIASENYASRAVRQAQGCRMTNKYAEGYPGKRWYEGCQFVDEAERLAIERARALFGAEHVNVQPHSGSQANMAVYFAVLQPGDAVLAMKLDQGGHLTHGHAVNFSGRLFRFIPYSVCRDTECLDYPALAALARQHQPKLIVAGASAYSRVIDFARLRAIADEAGALLMVDMAHIAGLVCGGCHPNPVGVAEFVTTTTHKTLRGPRGGMIFCQERFAQEIDRQVFPGIQGGPMMHTIAAKAVCLREASQPAFRAYAQQVVANARALARGLQGRNGLRIVSGGTDNHLMLVDLSATPVTGRQAAAALEAAGLVVNKNAIPFDRRSPAVTSGIRIGTAAVTTRGMREAEMERIAELIANVLRDPDNAAVQAETARGARELASAFPTP